MGWDRWKDGRRCDLQQEAMSCLACCVPTKCQRWRLLHWPWWTCPTAIHLTQWPTSQHRVADTQTSNLLQKKEKKFLIRKSTESHPTHFQHSSPAKICSVDVCNYQVIPLFDSFLSSDHHEGVKIGGGSPEVQTSKDNYADYKCRWSPSCFHNNPKISRFFCDSANCATI